MKKFFVTYLLLLVGTISLFAQDSVKVSLVTIYPGNDLYEIYGHTEIRVSDPSNTVTKGQDVAYNYGVFDYTAPHFVYRFVKGETDYMCGAFPANMTLKSYADENRKVVAQELNLTPEQAVKVRDFLWDNAQPENSTYRYQFVSDNCATRPRDVIEMALGKDLHYAQSQESVTIRDMMYRYNANYAWERFGIDLALGSGLDTTITYRQQMFIPMVLMDAFAHATVTVNGKTEPLVKQTVVLNPGSDEGNIEPATPWYLSPMFVALVLLALTIFYCVKDWKKKSVSRWYDTIIYVAYALGGCIIFFLIFVSTHESTSPNLNGLWLHPFYIIPAILLWVKKWQKVLVGCHIIIVVELILSFLAWLLLSQVANAAFFPLMLIPLLRSANYILVEKTKQK